MSTGAPSSPSGRWDVHLLFLDGPFQHRPTFVRQGPVVRIGANPGPDGLALPGYRGLDDRAAVITAYDGSQVHVAPIEPNQVRVAEHSNVRWSEIAPIRGPVWLAEGSVVHLGPPDRGATFQFERATPLGAWRGHSMVSEAAQADTSPAPSAVRAVDPWKRVPWWFLPGLFAVFAAFAGALALVVLIGQQRSVARLGPQIEGSDRPPWEAVLDEEASEELYAGAQDGFEAFVMKDNLEAAQDRTLEPRSRWDTALIRWVTRSEQSLARQRGVWRALERSRADYAWTLGQVRQRGLPGIFAAIPFRESGYNANARNPESCALGWWQFMPETAQRAGAKVANCTLRGGATLWSPTLLAPPLGVYQNADYVDHATRSCRIEGCQVDERTDLATSTRAALDLLQEAWDDPELRSSGAAVQLVIASHNAGYDDSRYRQGRISTTQVLPAYRKFVAQNKVDRAPDFMGRNITCEKKPAEGEDPRCGGLLMAETQHYVHLVIAWQMLAACYYGSHYPQEEVFKPYQRFARPGAYCDEFQVPTPAELLRTGTGA